MDLKNYPQFLCPNCRAVADLEADVDEVPANWEEEGNSSGSEEAQGGGNRRRGETRVPDGTSEAQVDDEMDRAIAASLQSSLRLNESHDITQTDHAIAADASTSSERLDESQSFSVPQLQMDFGPSLTQLTSPTQQGATGDQQSAEQNEGPLTPRNEAGPFIFDGAGGGIPGVPRQAEPSAAS